MNQRPSSRLPRLGIELVGIWQINLPYHTNISQSIPSSSVDTLITLAGNVALATRGKVRRAHMITLRPPTCSPRYIMPPTTSHLSPSKVIPKSMLRRFVSPHTAGRMFPLRCEKSFFWHSTCSSFCYFREPTRFITPP